MFLAGADMVGTVKVLEGLLGTAGTTALRDYGHCSHHDGHEGPTTGTKDDEKTHKFISAVEQSFVPVVSPS